MPFLSFTHEKNACTDSSVTLCRQCLTFCATAQASACRGNVTFLMPHTTFPCHVIDTKSKRMRAEPHTFVPDKSMKNDVGLLSR